MNLVLEEPVALRDTMESNEVFLPLGLVGFPELTCMEIVYSEDQLPFMWLQDKGESGLSFLVINPDGFLQNYTIELSELDAEFLEISNPEEALFLNLVTVQGETPRTVYANLVGPVVINRGSSKGKQVVLENHEKFSVRYNLYEERSLNGKTDI